MNIWPPYIAFVPPPVLSAEDAEFLTQATRRLERLTEDELERLANFLPWGTYGRDGRQVLKFKTLNSLETSHLENILITQTHVQNVTPIFAKVILYLLRKRWAERHYPVYINLYV